MVNTRECLDAFSQRFPGAIIAMETGTHSPWISRLFEARGHRVIVANARKVRAITTSSSKSDEEDARMLARLLSPVRHRSEACQRALLHIKVREALVRARVNLTNTLRFLLKSPGLQLPASVKAMAFTRKTRAALDAATCAIVEPLLVSLGALNARIKVLDELLGKMASEEYPDATRLQQIPGVGPITALCFVLTLESNERFLCTCDVGAYLGLVQRRDQSGNSDKQLGINKAGNTHLRCLLVNCAHYIMGPFGPPSDLREASLRIAARGGPIAKKRAVIAVARKLAVTLMTLWKSAAAHRPLLAQAAQGGEHVEIPRSRPNDCGRKRQHELFNALTSRQHRARESGPPCTARPTPFVDAATPSAYGSLTHGIPSPYRPRPTRARQRKSEPFPTNSSTRVLMEGAKANGA